MSTRRSAKQRGSARCDARIVECPAKGALPLALAQFIDSFAGSNMNVTIADISEDLNTTV
jgi:hypothetical protein